MLKFLHYEQESKSNCVGARTTGGVGAVGSNPYTRKRMAERAQIILWSAEGQTNVEMAKRLRTRVARICKWRSRFVKQGLEGLLDEPRPGQPRKYSAETERTILGKLDESPPRDMLSGTEGFWRKARASRITKSGQCCATVG